MKKCPFCKADIEDNARFCLYCMKPLNKKEVVLPRARKSRGWMIAAIVAILLLAAVVVLLILGGNIPDDPPISSQQSSFTETADTQGSSSQPSTASMPSSTSPATSVTSTSIPVTSAPKPTTQPTESQHIHRYSEKNTTATYLQTEATCTTSAVYYYSCECGDIGTATFTYGTKNGHTPVEDEGYPATCLVSGLSDGSHCSVCNTTIKAQTVLTPTGHSPVTDPKVPATCVKSGLTEGSHCKTCSATIVAQTEIRAKGHDYSDPTYTTPATCKTCGATTGSVLQQQPINLTKPSLPKVQYNRIRVTACTYSTQWNGDGTYDVTLTFTFTNLLSSVLSTGVGATLSGIEVSDGRVATLNPGQSGEASVYFFNVPAGNYTIIVE